MGWWWWFGTGERGAICFSCFSWADHANPFRAPVPIRTWWRAMWAAAFFFRNKKKRAAAAAPAADTCRVPGNSSEPLFFMPTILYYIGIELFGVRVYKRNPSSATHTHTQIHRHVHTDREKAPSRAACCGCCRSWLRFAVALEPASQPASQPACCGAVEQREAASRAARARRGRGLSLDSITGQSMFHTRNTHKATAIGR